MVQAAPDAVGKNKGQVSFFAFPLASVSALQFDVSDDNDDSNDPRVDLGTSFDVAALPFTLSAWVNPSDYTDWRTILSKRDGPSASQMRIDFGIAESSGHQVTCTCKPAQPTTPFPIRCQ